VQAGTWWSRMLGARIAVGEFESQRLGGMLSEPADPLGNNSWHRFSSGSYGTVYSRTATMMHDLEQQVGKAALERAFKQYYAQWKFRHPSIADFREAMAEGTGQRALVERLFADQVYATRKVDDRIAEFDSDEVLPAPGMVEYKGKPVELTQDHLDKAVQKVRDRWTKKNPKADADKRGPFPYLTRVLVRRDGAAVPQTLLVRFADGTSRSFQWNDTAGERWWRVGVTSRSRAVSVELDPERRIFLDKDKLDDGMTREANGSAARRWSADLAALLQTAFAQLVTL